MNILHGIQHWWNTRLALQELEKEKLAVHRAALYLLEVQEDFLPDLSTRSDRYFSTDGMEAASRFNTPASTVYEDADFRIVDMRGESLSIEHDPQGMSRFKRYPMHNIYDDLPENDLLMAFYISADEAKIYNRGKWHKTLIERAEEVRENVLAYRLNQERARTMPASEKAAKFDSWSGGKDADR